MFSRIPLGRYIVTPNLVEHHPDEKRTKEVIKPAKQEISVLSGGQLDIPAFEVFGSGTRGQVLGMKGMINKAVPTDILVNGVKVTDTKEGNFELVFDKAGTYTIEARQDHMFWQHNHLS